MKESDLLDLGFDQYEEDGFYYYSLDFGGGFSLISNASDEWSLDGIEVSIFDTDIIFRNASDLWEFVEVLKRIT